MNGIPAPPTHKNVTSNHNNIKRYLLEVTEVGWWVAILGGCSRENPMINIY